MIIPAIIARTQKELDEKLDKVEGFAELVQLDIMDGIFVPNNSLDFDFDISGRDTSFEAHLMITDSLGWIEKNWRKVDTIIVHFESCDKPGDIIKLVKSKGKKIGFAINPETAFNNIETYLDDIDQLLVMTVNPGFYGSKFLPETLCKISEARKIKPGMDIEVDGGVTPETIKLVNDAGANMLVSGSYILNSNNVKESMEKLRNIATA